MIIKIIGLLLIACTASSCQQVIKQKEVSRVDSTAVILDSSDSTTKNIIVVESNETKIALIENRILFPSRYRIWEDETMSVRLEKGNWKELYKKGNQYHISKANFIIENIAEEPCSGLPAEDIHSQNEGMLFFQIPSIADGNVDTVVYTDKIIMANKPLVLKHEGKEYKLVASGFDKFYQNIDAKESYRIKLYIDGQYVRTLIDQIEYNDTATTLEFIGDLDRDGKLDFIFSSPRDYEEERTIIILSSEKNHFEGNRQFDC